MADYLPLQILEIRENKTEEGEIRKTAVCRTVQPEQFNLNLSRLEADRLQRFSDNVGNILMVPVRRGEVNGRAFTSVADGYIFPATDVVATFELSDKKPAESKLSEAKKPEPAPASSSSLFVSKDKQVA